MSMLWQVGQKVVSIRSDFVACGETLPYVGAVYTIRDVEADDCGVWLRLEEIANVPRGYREGFREAQFNARGFRPAVEDKTQLALLTSILDRVNKRGRVRA